MRKYRARISPIHGIGVFTLRAVSAGERIGLFRGRGARRPLRTADGRIYAIGREEGGFLVPRRPAGLWFINHSCDANADIELTGRGARLIALRTIRCGEEITCDYRPSIHNGRLPCRCGVPACSGRI